MMTQVDQIVTYRSGYLSFLHETSILSPESFLVECVRLVKEARTIDATGIALYRAGLSRIWYRPRAENTIVTLACLYTAEYKPPSIWLTIPKEEFAGCISLPIILTLLHAAIRLDDPERFAPVHRYFGDHPELLPRSDSDLYRKAIKKWPLEKD